MRRVAPTTLVLLLLVPLAPLFTNGACTAEFEQASGDLERRKSELLTLSTATAYLSAHHMVYGTVPVKNTICRYYRDTTIRQQLGFNRAQQLVRLQTDMNPFHFLKVPFLNIEVDSAK